MSLTRPQSEAIIKELSAMSLELAKKRPFDWTKLLMFVIPSIGLVVSLTVQLQQVKTNASDIERLEREIAYLRTEIREYHDRQDRRMDIHAEAIVDLRIEMKDKVSR